MNDTPEPKNNFLSSSSFSLTSNNIEQLRRWINIQHTGKPLVPFGDKVSPELLEAHYTLNSAKTMTVEFVLSMDGSWIPKKLFFNNKRFKIKLIGN